MKKTKQKLFIVLLVMAVLAGIAFMTMTGNNDPYKSSEYKHVQITKMLEEDCYVYFYSTKDSDSISSNTGIKSLNRGISNLYFVNIKDDNSDIKPTTLLEIKDGRIKNIYVGVEEVNKAQEKILEDSWE